MLTSEFLRPIASPRFPIWEEIDRPAGAQPVPEWCRDLRVDWHDDYSNDPDFRLKTVGDVFDWPNKRYHREGARYISESDDGRIEQFSHAGPIGMNRVKMFRREDGTHHLHRRNGTQWPNGVCVGTDGSGARAGYEPGEWVEIDHLSTSQQDGFAGRHYMITLDDGRDLILRGPWHVGAPAGYQAAITVDCTKPDAYILRRGLKWHRRTGCFGLFLRQDVVVNILCRFAPHLRLARVDNGYGWNVQPMKPEWDKPKHWINEEAREAFLAARAVA